MTTAARRCPVEGHLLTRSAKVYTQEYLRTAPQLKSQLQCELNDPWIQRIHDLPEARADGHTWNTEVRMVQRIEKLRPELGRDPLYNREIFGEIEVQVGVPGPSQNPDSGVSEDRVRDEAGRARRGGRRDKGVDVEPLVHGPPVVGQASVRNAVRAAAALATDIGNLRLIDRQRQTCLP